MRTVLIFNFIYFFPLLRQEHKKIQLCFKIKTILNRRAAARENIFADASFNVQCESGVRTQTDLEIVGEDCRVGT